MFSLVSLALAARLLPGIFPGTHFILCWFAHGLQLLLCFVLFFVQAYIDFESSVGQIYQIPNR
jgi:hypothetical protein